MSKQSITILRLRERATLDWIVANLGLEATQVHPEGGDVLEHAELRYGSSVLMASTTGQLEQAAGHASVYLTVDTDDEVDAAHARAVAAGATSVLAPEDQEYGGRNATVQDPEGNTWSIGSYQPA